MARPIKETPILSGKDAERFVWNMYHVEKVPDSFRQEMERVYQKYKKMANFDLWQKFYNKITTNNYQRRSSHFGVVVILRRVLRTRFFLWQKNTASSTETKKL